MTASERALVFHALCWQRLPSRLAVSPAWPRSRERNIMGSLPVSVIPFTKGPIGKWSGNHWYHPSQWFHTDQGITISASERQMAG